MPEWPAWWHWDIVLSIHLLKRMVDRQFNEADLRTMLDDATGYRADLEPGRWVITTGHDGAQWEIIVEPDDQARALVVVTAYPFVS